MNAKEAFLFELGDFGMDASLDNKETMNPKEKSTIPEFEASSFEIDDNGNIKDMEFIEENNETETEEDSSDDEQGTAPSEKSERIQPSDDMTAEEIDACIEAADDAMNTTDMSPEIYDWGLGFIKKMYAKKDALLRQKIESIDWTAAHDQWEQEAQEEDEREKAEREQFLQG